MQIRVFRSGKGDCLLLTSNSGKHILVDGGVPRTYERHWAKFVGRMRKSDTPIDMVCVSHSDSDHIGGVLDLMKNESAWRSFESGDIDSQPKVIRPPEICQVWFNTFESIGKPLIKHVSNTSVTGREPKEILERAAQLLERNQEGPHASNQHEDATPPGALSRQLQFVTLSINQAIELSQFISSSGLNISLNREFEGNFVRRRRRRNTYSLGDFEVTVLGPTKTQLDEFKKHWDAEVGAIATAIEQLNVDPGSTAMETESSRVRHAKEVQSQLLLTANQLLSKPNLASIILHVENQGRTILLTGDADAHSIVEGLRVTKHLQADRPIKVDVFKVPHHGATDSYSDELARSVIAEHYVFCGNGRYKNPEPAVIDCYLKILMNDKFRKKVGINEKKKIKFWFNCGKKLAQNTRREKHWEEVGEVLRRWLGQHRSRFSFETMSRGNSFLVK